MTRNQEIAERRLVRRAERAHGALGSARWFDAGRRRRDGVVAGRAASGSRPAREVEPPRTLRRSGARAPPRRVQRRSYITRRGPGGRRRPRRRRPRRRGPANAGPADAGPADAGADAGPELAPVFRNPQPLLPDSELAQQALRLMGAPDAGGSGKRDCHGITRASIEHFRTISDTAWSTCFWI